MIVRPNTGNFLVTSLCKVRSSLIGCQNLWICLLNNVELSLFTESRMHKVREIICQVPINILHKKKIFQFFGCKQLQRWNSIRELSGKWLNNTVQLCFFLWLRTNFLYPIPSSDNHSQIKNILQFQIFKNDFKSTLYNAKHGVCVNPISHRKLYVWIS